MPFRRALLVVRLASIALLVARGASAAGEDLARARVLDQQGVRAYREERYNDAIHFFEEALKLGGPPSEIWNIAKCHVRMDEPEEAVKSIQEYLEQKGLSAADRAEAEQQLHEIERRHSMLTVASSPAGGLVYVDGKRWPGLTPATIDVAPGEHKVVVELAGYEPLERTVTAKLGRAVIVEGSLAKTDAPSPARPEAYDPKRLQRAHRLTLGAEIGISMPEYGSIGGNVGPAGYLSAAYVAYDDPRLVVTVGAAMTFTADSWSNTSGLPNTNPNCENPIPSDDTATALSGFVQGGAFWRALPGWRLGGDLGVGFATYSVGEAGRDVFVPTCHPSSGVKPAFHIDAVASYAFSSEFRVLLAPVVLELQPAFDGASRTPRDATGLWLRWGAAAGLAFDLL